MGEKPPCSNRHLIRARRSGEAWYRPTCSSSSDGLRQNDTEFSSGKESWTVMSLNIVLSIHRVAIIFALKFSGSHDILLIGETLYPESGDITIFEYDPNHRIVFFKLVCSVYDGL